MRVVVSAIQMDSGESKERNLRRALELISEATSAGARVLALPELFSFMGLASQAVEMAESIPGPTIEAMQEAARRHAVYVLSGSILERNPQGGPPYNTSVLVGPDGALLALYRKIHLFDVNLPEHVTYFESSERTAGTSVVTAQTDFGIVGLSVCYDVRFPELYREHCRRGAVALFVPAAFSLHTGRDHWRPLLQARAIENQCFVVAPAQIGAKAGGFVCNGRSCIIDPWGTVLAEAPDCEGPVTANLDFDYLHRVRESLPALAHRKLGLRPTGALE